MPGRITFSVSELAKVMGVDDPSRSFLGVVPMQEGAYTKLDGMMKEIMTPMPNEAVLAELAQNYLPTLLRARSEGIVALETPPGFDWDAIVSLCHGTPQYARFIRDHPSSPAYYEWLLKKCEKELPTWSDLADGVVSLDSGAKYRAGLRYSVGVVIAIATNLEVTLRAFNDPTLLFPPHLSNIIISLAAKLERLYVGWTDAGRPEAIWVYDVSQIVKSAGTTAKVLRREVPVEREKGGFGWWRCSAGDQGLVPVSACGQEGLRVCSKCKSVRYCSQEHQALAWPTHRPTCFAKTW